MIKKFIDKGFERSKLLRNYIETHVMSYYGDYKSLFKIVNEIAFKNITELDFGDYEGTKIFVFTNSNYQPNTGDTYGTAVEYGSCECCDQLLNIMDCETGLPNMKQADGFMALAMHMVQKIKCFNGLGEQDEEN